MTRSVAPSVGQRPQHGSSGALKRAYSGDSFLVRACCAFSKSHCGADIRYFSCYLPGTGHTEGTGGRLPSSTQLALFEI
jgi:hypothetical protein